MPQLNGARVVIDALNPSLPVSGVPFKNLCRERMQAIAIIISALVNLRQLLFSVPMNGAENNIGSHEYQVRVTVLSGLDSLLQELGYDSLEIMREAGVDPNALENPNIFIPFASFLKALYLSRAATGIEHFGLLLGQRQTISIFGSIGSTMVQAPNLEVAINSAITFSHLHTTAAFLRLVQTGDVACWRIEQRGKFLPGSGVRDDVVMAQGVNLMRTLLGMDWEPDLIMVQHRPPKDDRPYRNFFRCPVEFDAGHNQIIFDATLLSRPFITSDQRMFDALQNQLKASDPGHKLDLASSVRQAILDRVKAGRCTLPGVANDLGMSNRSLQRHLKRAGSSFRQELEQVRFDIAVRYLERSNLSLTKLALMLGYADLPTFSHSFKHSSGVSPVQWRREKSAV